MRPEILQICTVGTNLVLRNLDFLLDQMNGWMIGVGRIGYYDQQLIQTLLMKLKAKVDALHLSQAIFVLNAMAMTSTRDIAFIHELLFKITSGDGLWK